MASPSWIRSAGWLTSKATPAVDEGSPPFQLIIQRQRTERALGCAPCTLGNLSIFSEGWRLLDSAFPAWTFSLNLEIRALSRRMAGGGGVVVRRIRYQSQQYCFDPSNGTGTPDGTAKRIVHTALSPRPFLLKLLTEDANNHTYVLLEARELNLRNALPQNRRSLSRRFRTE
jgi:hypothetical protein